MKLPQIANENNIALEMAVWLLHDEYDLVKKPNYISATALLKPLRHLILPSRVPPQEKVRMDVSSLIASAMGKSIHAGIEKAWLDPDHVRSALEQLGYEPEIFKQILVNPTKEDLEKYKLANKEEPILVYLEQRALREITVKGVTFTIGGKFDMVLDGTVTDTKTTTVYAWMKGESREEQYALQGSIYRWLNPDKVTHDKIHINFIFTDWQKRDAKTVANYPPLRIQQKEIQLLSPEATEKWIIAKLTKILESKDLPEHKIEECSDEELWMTKPSYKYYSDPTKAFGGAGRSTRNFADLAEANAFAAEKGKGQIITIPGSPKRCAYCNAFPICTQKDRYTHE